MDLADIVHPYVPLEAGAMEHMGEAARGVVFFEDKHPPPSRFGQERRGPHPADTGADHDGVEGPGVVELFVWRANKATVVQQRLLDPVNSRTDRTA